MATSPAPEAYATPDDQGDQGVCTRNALGKAVANGFMTQEFGNGIQLDFNQDVISQILVNLHKVKVHMMFVTFYIILILYYFMTKK